MKLMAWAFAEHDFRSGRSVTDVHRFFGYAIICRKPNLTRTLTNISALSKPRVVACDTRHLRATFRRAALCSTREVASLRVLKIAKRAFGSMEAPQMGKFSCVELDTQLGNNDAFW